MIVITLEHGYHVVERSEGTIYSNSIHFPRVKGNMQSRHPVAKSVHSNLHHHVSEIRLVLPKEVHLSLDLKGTENPKLVDH